MVEKSDWEESLKKHSVSRLVPKIIELEHRAVPLKNLTSDPNWNEYLAILSGFLEKSKEEEAEILRLLSDEKTVSQDEIMRLKLLLSRSKMRTLTLEDCMNLPNKIIEASISNKKFLETA